MKTRLNCSHNLAVRPHAGCFNVASILPVLIAGLSMMQVGRLMTQTFPLAGIPQWVREFGTTGNDYAGGVALDPSGNVLIVGGSSDFTDAFVRKYDPRGNVVWERVFGVGYGGGQFVGTDRVGNVYVVGTAMGPLPRQPYAGATDIFVRKYSRSGKELWTREFGSSSYESAFSAAFDNAGNIYLAGYTMGALPGQNFSGLEDAFAAKISSQGNILWITQMGNTGGNYANNITFDSSGDAYVTGNLNNDGFVSRLNAATGSVVWQVTLPNDRIFTEGTDVAVSSSGVYVAYELAGATSNEALIRKYGFDATELWSNLFPGGYFSNAGMRHIFVNTRDDVYSVFSLDSNGQGGVRKLDASGVEQWTVTPGGQGAGQTQDGGLDKMGNLWLHQASIGGDMAVVELDPSGSTLLRVQYGSPGSDFPSVPRSLVVGHGGEVYVTSTVQGPVNGQPYLGVQDCLLTKFIGPRGSRAGSNGSGGQALFPDSESHCLNTTGVVSCHLDK